MREVARTADVVITSFLASTEHGNRSQKHDDDGPAKLDRLGVQDLPHRGIDELEADGADHDSDDKARKVLEAAMAIGVAFICRPACKLEADQGHDAACRIGEVVHGVGDDGDRACDEADRALAESKQDVEDDAYERGSVSGMRPFLWCGILRNGCCDMGSNEGCHCHFLLSGTRRPKS